jgi:tetratricopeptide (TPR) repeat protein
MELDPELADIFAFYSLFYLVPMRRFDEAVEWIQKAIKLDPLSAELPYDLGFVYLSMRQYDCAIEQLRKALELNPQYPSAKMFLVQCYMAIGKLDEGIRDCEMGAQLSGRTPLHLAFLGGAYAWAGRIGEAQKLLEELKKIGEKAYVPSSAFAAIYAGLKEIDKAFNWYEKVIEERETAAALYYLIPLFDPLRSHPRYHAMLRKMNLEP